MSVNLVKGQKIGLTADKGLKKILVGLGWDAAEQTGSFLKNLFIGKPAPIDYDCSCILLGADGKVISDELSRTAVYFNNLTDASGAIVHRGDNLTGEGEGDDEQITVDLSRVPENVERLVFAVNIYNANVREQHFGMIKNAFIRLQDMDSGEEICRFSLADDYSGMTGMIMGEIYRQDGEWKFNAIGQGLRQASRLGSIVNLYR
ncbi:MAG: TerD family protein [Clostridiales bacterium]|nr:TerD family protein [Clostridiales bacterium]